MPNIKPNKIKEFYKIPNNVPEKLSGVWSLAEIQNMSILMSFSNSEYIKNKEILVDLSKKNSWLFKNQSIGTRILNLFRYKYLFVFDKNVKDNEFTKAQIYIKLGCIPLYFPKWLTNWTLEIDPNDSNKLIRKTSIFWFKNTYILHKIIDKDGNIANEEKYNELVNTYKDTGFHSIN